jgi:hypothetical protein
VKKFDYPTIAIIALAAALAAWWIVRRTGAPHLDLVAQLEQAEKTPDDSGFTVDVRVLNGEALRAIAAPPEGRIAWNVRVPKRGWLRLSIGTSSESWNDGGDGVDFTGGVTTDEGMRTLFSQQVNPKESTAQRRWIPVMIDLSPYADEDVQIVLETHPSPPDRPADDRYDKPLWGAPEIVTR